MTAIYKRELKSYMTSMIGWVFIAFFIAIGSVYFLAYNLSSGYTYFSYALCSTTLFLMLGVPVLTMRSFAEEQKNKTEQLLMTAPISLTNIVMGKYLAMLTILGIPNLVFCIFPVIIKSYGEAHLKIDYMSIFTYFLLGCLFIAIGMYLSARTESQVIAAITTFAALFIVYMWEGLVSFLPFTTIQTFLYKFTAITVLENVAVNKLLDIPGLIAYISVAGIFVFLTIQTLQKRRWN